jgi:hypothetical protein
VHRGQGNSPESDTTWAGGAGSAGGGRGDSRAGEGDGRVRVPGGGGMPQFKQGGTIDVVGEKLEG